MGIRGVLFDFDGTLTRPGSLDFPGIKKALGCPLEQPILEYLDTLEASERHKALDILERMENQAARQSVPNLDALHLLQWLKDRGLPFGLVTRNGLQSVKIALRAFKPLEERDFGVIITREDAPPKPDPQGLLVAAARLGLDPAHFLFVGDYRFDIIAGTAAGMVTVLLTNGNPSTLLPQDPRPHYLVRRLGEVPPIITACR